MENHYSESNNNIDEKTTIVNLIDEKTREYKGDIFGAVVLVSEEIGFSVEFIFKNVMLPRQKRLLITVAKNKYFKEEENTNGITNFFLW